MASFKQLSEGFDRIDSRELHEKLSNFFPACEVQEFMFNLSVQNTGRIYLVANGYQIDWTGDQDFFTVL